MATVTTDGATTTGAASGQPWRGDDFPAWLPSMLVRELRQGLRSGVSLWAFVLLHLVLVVHAVVTLLVTLDTPGAGSGRDASLWIILVVALVLVIPLRGLTAIASERVGNNLDLVRLTRLSATRIVLDKWAALVAQMLLVTAATLPYFVLRYFLGGVDIVADLWLLCGLLVVGALVAALAVYASTLRARERVAVLALLVPIGMNAVGPIMMLGPMSVWHWSVACAVYAALLLDAAASSIAPPSENRAFWRRLLALACAAAIAAAGLFGSRREFPALAILLGLPVVVLSIGALCERPLRVRRPYAAFARGGGVGRAAAAVLTPGWATGLVFVALAGGLTVVGLSAGLPGPGLPAVVTVAVAALVFPLPLLVFLPRLEERLTLYVAAQLIAVVVISLVAYPRVFQRVDPGVPLAIGVVVLVSALALVARPWWREMRETQRLVGGKTAS